jgi:3-carboxy-cis,cis-muconate cycloisomerase
MHSRLIDGLVTTDAVSRAFSDGQLLRAMLQFEAALARAEGVVGVIPDAAATAISDVALTPAAEDTTALLTGLRANATLAIAVVGALTRRVESISPMAGSYVHWGATSQDVHDTAVILCLRDAWATIERDHLRLIAALDALAVRHADAVMLGRTLLQPAVPTTFGLKAAGWLGGVARSWRSWSEAFDRTQVLQFGGAAGTLSALGGHGPAVERALADELGLEVPDAPWHAHRDRLSGFVATAGVYVGALGKIARDISLLMQPEVGEVFESGGGSSTMPHKRNPSKCAAVLACAHRMPGLVAAMLTTMTQEHERAVGGWHAESATLVDAVQASAAAVAALAEMAETLTVDEDRMRLNVEATGGVIFAERLTMRLAPGLGRSRASALVKAMVDESARSGRPFGAVIAAEPEAAALLDADDRAGLFDARTYLGSADTFRARLLAAAAVPGSRKH